MDQISKILHNINSFLINEDKNVEESRKSYYNALFAFIEMNDDNAFSHLEKLQPLLEKIAKEINKPNQKRATVREWLIKLNLNQAVSSNQCKAILAKLYLMINGEWS